MSLKAATVVISGATRGIGKYCAEKLNDAGFRVIGLARTASSDVNFEIRTTDVSDPISVAKALDDLKRDSTVYGLINCAGIASLNLLVTTPVDSIQKIINTNLLGTIYCCKAIAPALIRRKSGRIINFSTIAVALGLAGESVYVASKAGVEGFSRAFAREMAAHGVTVNSVAPGPVDTNLIANVPAHQITEVLNQQIVKRKASFDDVWKLVNFLLSPESGMVTGQVLHVGGV